MKNLYTEPKFDINSFNIRENISNTQDTEDLSVTMWPEEGAGTSSEVQQGGQ